MKKALIVGIDHYKKGQLDFCATNAYSVNNALLNIWGYEASIQLMATNTKSDIVNKPSLIHHIRDVFAGESDIALFYFSGHGYINGSSGCILTSDCNSFNDGLSITELLQLTQNSKSKHKLIIFEFYHFDYLGAAIPNTFISFHDNVMIVNTTSGFMTKLRKLIR